MIAYTTGLPHAHRPYHRVHHNSAPMTAKAKDGLLRGLTMPLREFESGPLSSVNRARLAATKLCNQLSIIDSNQIYGH